MDGRHGSMMYKWMSRCIAIGDGHVFTFILLCGAHLLHTLVALAAACLEQIDILACFHRHLDGITACMLLLNAIPNQLHATRAIDFRSIFFLAIIFRSFCRFFALISSERIDVNVTNDNAFLATKADAVVHVHHFRGLGRTALKGVLFLWVHRAKLRAEKLQLGSAKP